MSFDGNVIPGVIATLKTLQGSTGNTIRSIHLGEQYKVSGRGPVAWIMGNTWDEPEYEGSDTEPTNWQIEIRLLYQWQSDQRHAEEVLGALIEPVRAAFRTHRKLIFAAQGINSPTTTIARAKTTGGQWLYIVINRVMYRMLIINVSVKEKVPVSVAVGG